MNIMVLLIFFIKKFIGVELDGLTLGVEYGTKDLLYKKKNNLISKNKPF